MKIGLFLSHMHYFTFNFLEFHLPFFAHTLSILRHFCLQLFSFCYCLHFPKKHCTISILWHSFQSHNKYATQIAFTNTSVWIFTVGFLVLWNWNWFLLQFHAILASYLPLQVFIPWQCNFQELLMNDLFKYLPEIHSQLYLP